MFARKGYGGVSLRELADACNVRPFTIQNHFGSKPGLYQAVLCRWDDEVRERILARLAAQDDFPLLVEEVVDDLFDFFLAKRDWVALRARAALGEGLPKGVKTEERSWVAFIDQSLRARRIGSAQLDIGMLLITVEGMLNNHALSAAHYQELFGHDVTDARIRRRAKKHIKHVILTLLGVSTPAVPAPAKHRRRVRKETNA